MKMFSLLAVLVMGLDVSYACRLSVPIELSPTALTTDNYGNGVHLDNLVFDKKPNIRLEEGEHRYAKKLEATVFRIYDGNFPSHDMKGVATEFIASRINYVDTMIGIGFANVYKGQMNIQQQIERSNGLTTITTSDGHFTDENILTTSRLVFDGNKLVSFQITHPIFKIKNGRNFYFDGEYETVCLRSATLRKNE